MIVNFIKQVNWTIHMIDEKVVIKIVSLNFIIFKFHVKHHVDINDKLRK